MKAEAARTLNNGQMAQISAAATNDYSLGVHEPIVYNATAGGISGSAPIERCPAIIIRLGNVSVLGAP
jgi:hypothetical protein